MTRHELEIATGMLDDYLRGSRMGIAGMGDAYWGAKALLEEIGMHVEVIGDGHVLFTEDAMACDA